MWMGRNAERGREATYRRIHRRRALSVTPNLTSLTSLIKDDEDLPPHPTELAHTHARALGKARSGRRAREEEFVASHALMKERSVPCPLGVSPFSLSHALL
jgi:hypothetical protein